VFVDQGMQGLGGVVLLAALALGLTVQSLSLVVLGLLTVWVGLAVWARQSYIQAFRETLPHTPAERQPEPEAPPDPPPNAPMLLAALTSPRTGPVLEALDAMDEA